MARLVFRTAARRAIAEIASYVADASGDRAAADRFVSQLIDHCEKLARLPGSVGRPRPELGPNYRSSVFGNYVVFFRYGHDDSPRSHVYIVHVVHSARDLSAHVIPPET